MTTTHQDRRYREGLARDVDGILKDEAQGEKQAFADWLRTLYLGGLDGERLDDFDAFMKSPLALDMIADWQHECDDRAARIELLDHILSLYSAEDFDEPEHYNEHGDAILPYGASDDKHYDEHGNPIRPYIPLWDRRAPSSKD